MHLRWWLCPSSLCFCFSYSSVSSYRIELFTICGVFIDGKYFIRAVRTTYFLLPLNRDHVEANNSLAPVGYCNCRGQSVWKYYHLDAAINIDESSSNQIAYGLMLIPLGKYYTANLNLPQLFKFRPLKVCFSSYRRLCNCKQLELR